MELSLIKLKYLVDVVELRSFTKAAQKNHVAQTSVSQQIKELETFYKLQLINRKTSPVTTTQAGAIFYKYAKIILQDTDVLNKEMAQYQSKKLRIAYTSMQDLHYLTEIFAILPHYQNKVQVKKELMTNLSSSLREGLYDLAVTFDSEFKNEPDIGTIPLVTGYYQAGMRKDHPLADKKMLTLDQLYHYPLVMIYPGSIGRSYDMMIARSRKVGKKPLIREQVDNVESELFAIQQENLIGFFPEDFPITFENKNLIMIPIKDSPHTYQRVLAYDNSQKERLASLLDKINDLLKHRQKL